MCSLPVRMFWKASSTLLASRADVSIKERWFSPSREYISQSVGTRLGSAQVVERHTRKGLGLFRWDRTEMPQIALVSHQHDDDVGISMVPELFQPSCHVFVGLVFADVVDEKRTDSAPVVGRGDGTVAFLACRVPDLCLDCLGVDLD